MRIKRHAPPRPVAMTKEEFARIRTKVLKMTQEELRLALGLRTVVTVSRYETGAAPIHEDRAAALRMLVERKKQAATA